MKKEIVFDGSNFQVLKKRFLLDKKTYQQMLSSFSWLEPAKGEIENRYLMSQRNILYKDGFYYYESGNPLWEYFTIYIYEDNAYFKYEKAFGLESFIRTKVDFSRYTDLDDFKFYNECECLVGSYPTIHYNEVGEYYYKNSSNCERKIYFNENKVAFKFEYCNHDNPSQICVANISPYNGSKLTAPDYDNSLLKHRANEALMECISFIDKDTGESYTPSYNGGHNTINHIKNPGTVIIPKYYVTRTEDNTEILLSVGSLCMFGVDLPPGMTLEERDVYYYHNYSITYDSSNIYFSTNFAPGGRCSQYQIYISSVEYGDMSFYLEQPIICMFEFTDL